MSKPDGGAAFPNITPDMMVDGGPGMTLRDYFAGHALAELVTGFVPANITPDDAETIAIAADMIASAMLEERDR